MTITLRNGKDINEEPLKGTKEEDVEKVAKQDAEPVALIEECSFMVTQNMPKKLKDLGNFTLPIQIGSSKVVHALSDFRSSINLMPLSLFNTLGLGKPRPRLVLLQLENGTIALTKGVIEDVLIKVAIEGTLINVIEGTLIIRLENEKVVFNVYKLLNTLSHYKNLCMITVIERAKCKVMQMVPQKTALDFLIEQPKQQLPNPYKM
ncbi:uncharacterized protein LOC124885736 [Capsicum annuum]|uniref:uncharacterized protein LOC124885736 n=1 Tax=Capsicum annuum TaxID=4072 RepID=UPI001FB0943A|nr:uncharacterized protein LOC124885736 [Capsicum annuum]